VWRIVGAGWSYSKWWSSEVTVSVRENSKRVICHVATEKNYQESWEKQKMKETRRIIVEGKRNGNK
jgi:hypothetical protein